MTCLTVDGNRAWFAGVIERSNTPGLINQEFGWGAVDNGRPGSGTPDQVSFPGVPVNGAADAFCNDQPPDPSLQDIERGNIRIRGAAQRERLTICHYRRHALEGSTGSDNLSDFVLNRFGNPGREFCEDNGGRVITVPRDVAIRVHNIGP